MNHFASTSRRGFLTTSALGVAVAARPWTVNAAAPKNLSESPFVRLAIATICFDGFGNRHHGPTFELAPELGVKNIEFNLWYADQLLPSYIDDLSERCVKARLTPISIQASAFGGEGQHGIAKDVTHKLWCMEAAKRLGCRRVKFTGAKRNTQGGLKSVIEVCRELAPAAEQMGMLLTLENHAGNGLENIADYDEIFSKISSPNVGLCLDTGHFEGAGIALADVVERFHSRTLHVDLKDCAAFGKGHNTVVFGEGTTDFKAFLELLAAKRYSGYLVIEQAWGEPKEPVVANLRRGVDNFRKYERE